MPFDLRFPWSFGLPVRTRSAAAEHGVHDGPGAVFFARAQVGVDPKRDDGGRVAEDQLDLFDARSASDEGRGEEVAQIVGHHVVGQLDGFSPLTLD
ncbi:hypothetical protein GA0115259_1027712 [Streptomyces sp. MnatMP-M17]|nr:hypothetical protein GA0115259_1027712 [Streptomyces sp. MnatMP-M17]